MQIGDVIMKYIQLIGLDLGLAESLKEKNQHFVSHWCKKQCFRYKFNKKSETLKLLLDFDLRQVKSQ